MVKLIVRRIIFLLIASFVVGVAYNSASPIGLRWSQPGQSEWSPGDERPAGTVLSGADDDSHPATLQTDSAHNEPQSVSWDEVRMMQAAEEVVLVDARTAGEYQAGTIPGAVSLPYHELDTLMPDFQKRHPKNRWLIVFCSDNDCATSEKVAKTLQNDYGFEHVLHFPGGYSEWLRRRAPEEDAQ